MAINSTVSYEVAFNNPNNHLFSVRLRIEQPDPEGQTLVLPNWIPGSYMIRDFAKNIVSLKAVSDGQNLRIEKLNKSCWKIQPCDSALLLEYDIYALDLSVRSAHLDNTHAFFNGTSLFLEPFGQADKPVTVTIKKNSHSANQWTVKTSLQQVDVDKAGFGLYQAQDYEELIDCPVEISHSVDIGFKVKDVPHYLHLTGDMPERIDEQLLAKDLARICQEHAALFNDELPVQAYRFLTMVVENGYGGLEHKSSTALVCSPGDLPLQGQVEQTADYRKFLGLCSHEYFHLWNVKRIRPLQFQRHDLSKEVHTSLLWAFEGITSYYDDLALLRSATITLQNYLELMAATLTRLLRSRGRTRQSLVDSSFDAWTKFYKQDENAINAIVSYYTKGAIVAFGLDITMRLMTDNKISLDDLMRKLWHEHGKTDSGVAEDAIESMAEQLVGHSLKPFFDKYLRSTRELPVEEWLNTLGIGMRLRIEKDSSDMGGFVEFDNLADADKIEHKITLGCRLKDGSTEVMSVYHDSPAEVSGICPGDVLVAINSRKVTPANFEKLVSGLPRAKMVPLHVFRRDCLYQFEIMPEAKSENVCELFLLPDSEVSDFQLKMRDNWKTSGVAAQ